jgi:integrative and conjugative element protein (TIGR02256 family)
MGYIPPSQPRDVVVVEVIGPGPAARHFGTRFEPDSNWQMSRIAEVYVRSQRCSTYLGGWHSHARSTPHPSRLDRKTARRIARYREACIQRPSMLITAMDADEDWQVTVYRYLLGRLLPMKVVLFPPAEIE